MWRRFLREAQNIIDNCKKFRFLACRALTATLVKDPMRCQSEKLLFDFGKKEDFKALQHFSDEMYGGCSTASLMRNEQVWPGRGICDQLIHQGFAKFSGCCSSEIKDGSQIKRSGFCGMKTAVETNIIPKSPANLCDVE